jgi:hypothetical protein
MAEIEREAIEEPTTEDSAPEPYDEPYEKYNKDGFDVYGRHRIHHAAEVGDLKALQKELDGGTDFFLSLDRDPATFVVRAVPVTASSARPLQGSASAFVSEFNSKQVQRSKTDPTSLRRLEDTVPPHALPDAALSAQLVGEEG